MAYEFTFTPRFQKHFKGLTAQEKKQLKNKLELLAENPSHPSLRTKRIQGTTDLFECSVNMGIRIIWYYESDKMIILVDVRASRHIKAILSSGAVRHDSVPLFAAFLLFYPAILLICPIQLPAITQELLPKYAFFSFLYSQTRLCRAVRSAPKQNPQ